MGVERTNADRTQAHAGRYRSCDGAPPTMRRRPPYHSLQCRHLPPDASFIAHLSHANRQPQGTASKVTGLPHLQVVTCVEITLSRVHRRERGRAGTVERWNGHLHAVEQASRRWRGGHDPAVAETRRENLIHAQIVLLPALPLRQLWPLRVGPEGRTAWERRCLQSYASPMPLLGRWAARLGLRQSTICSESRRGFFPPRRSLQPRPRYLNRGQARPVYAC